MADLDCVDPCARRAGSCLALLGLHRARPALAQAQAPTQRIAAVVNDDVITTQDLIDRINLGIATSGLPNDDATRQRLAPQVLRGFIDEKLQLQEAKRLGTDVTDAEIDQALQTIAQRNRTTAAELTALPRRARPESTRAAGAAQGADRLDQGGQPRAAPEDRRDPGTDRPRPAAAAPRPATAASCS